MAALTAHQVRAKSGVPIASDFDSDTGTPIVIDDSTGDLYVLVGTTITKVASSSSLVSGKLQAQEYTTGSGNFTVPDSVTDLWVTLAGPGGGGGANSGGGGGGGEVLYRFPLKATSGALIAYALGAVGTGGINGGAAATDGGNTTFGTLTARGGKLGVAASGAGGAGAGNAGAGAGGTAGGGAGGSPTAANPFLPGAGGGGGPAGVGGTTAAFAGGTPGATGAAGGASHYGIGGNGGAPGLAPTSGKGGGGGGGNAAQNGGAGAPGYILIEWIA